ncbi:uncharacterized protein LOC133653251 [Entelurus aequoreus]|uniref:uncharacterized protein LOC133653251 n=1 Tax=Entelurus aequoreus TaxID=161455 RepID=UPI002B1D569A|nr:uncharacterized protein LOC133653251 [Entelurus aequoreus]
MCFVDLEKAFHRRVPREVLWGVLRDYGVSDCLIVAVRSLYDQYQSLVHSLYDQCQSLVRSLYDQCQNLVRSLYDQCQNLVHSLYDQCQNLVHSLYDQCQSLVRSLYDQCQNLVRSLYDQCQNLVHSLYDQCQSLVHSLYDQCQNLVHSLYDQCQSLVRSLYDQCQSLVRSLYDQCQNLVRIAGIFTKKTRRAADWSGRVIACPSDLQRPRRGFDEVLVQTWRHVAEATALAHTSRFALLYSPRSLLYIIAYIIIECAYQTDGSWHVSLGSDEARVHPVGLDSC